MTSATDDHDRPAGEADRDGPPDEQGGTRFVFVDTEATGLDHSRHELTEVSWIVRFEDGTEVERQYFPQHTLDAADPEALELTRYEERIAPRSKSPATEWLDQFLEDARDATIVGAVPDFDVHHLRLMCRKLDREPTWDHHLVDVETLALPLIAAGPETPRGLASTCAALGIEHDDDQAHGALYDARQTRAVFDAAWDHYRRMRATGDTLPPPVPRSGDPSGDDAQEGDGDESAGRPRDESAEGPPGMPAQPSDSAASTS